MIILASQSPRRKELIRKLVDDFVVIPADIDENVKNVAPSDLPALLSKLKAYSIFATHPNDTVLACDTVVIHKGELMGKPKTKEEAISMLKKLSGDKHVVLSGYTFINKNKEITRSVKTVVHFNKLSDETILKYVESGSPMDKAGGYGIQDKEYNLVDYIEGSLDNVIGLPVEDIKKHCF